MPVPMPRTRLKRTTVTTPNGTKVETVRVVKAPELEWRLQAAAVRRLREMPEYVCEPDDKPAAGRFTLAGDFNASRRSAQESVKAKATGITAGEHDLRIYMAGARLGLIEFKGEKTRVSPEQSDRHELLAWLGFKRQSVLRAVTEDEAADQAEALVRGWLAANDNVQPVAVSPAVLTK